MESMTPKIYAADSTEIGQVPGLPVPHSFYKDNPQWQNARVQVEVLSDQTLLVRLVSDGETDKQEEEEEEFEDPKMLRMFLDFLMEEVTKDPSKLVPYTAEMKAEEDKLLEGVTLDDDE